VVGVIDGEALGVGDAEGLVVALVVGVIDGEALGVGDTEGFAFA
jgi:hypothetical protein